MLLLLLIRSATATCPSPAWDTTCYTLLVNSEQVFLGALHPDRGEVCAVTTAVDAEWFGVASVVVVDSEAYTCADGVVASLSATTGALTTTTTTCEGLASDGAGLLVINGPPDGAASFTSARDALSATPAPLATFSMLGATRVATDGAYWYGLTHDGRMLRTHELKDGSYLGAVALDGFDGWVWGLAAYGGELYVLDDGRSDASEDWAAPSILVFDPASGVAVSTTTVTLPESGVFARGLWCTGS